MKKKKIIVISIVITVIVALIIVFIGYKKGIYLFSIEEKNKMQKDYSVIENEIVLDGESLTNFTGSDFLYRLIESINIKEIHHHNNTMDYTLYLRNGEIYDITINDSEKLIDVDYNSNYYQVSITENFISIYDENTQTSQEYSTIEGIANEIDKTIAVATVGLFYAQNVGDVKYLQETEPSTNDRTYWCLHARRSFCNEERKMRKMEEYCGGRPAYVGTTDCGCLWGDFYCVCITNFRC